MDLAARTPKRSPLHRTVWVSQAETLTWPQICHVLTGDLGRAAASRPSGKHLGLPGWRKPRELAPRWFTLSLVHTHTHRKVV